MGVPRQRIQRGSLWTGVVLLTLTCGVRGFSQEDLPPRLSPSEQQDTALLALFRDLYEQELLRKLSAAQPVQLPPEFEPDQQRRDYEPLPLPLALRLGDGNQDNKRSSYMALCHFKICSVGRKRSNLRAMGRF